MYQTYRFGDALGHQTHCKETARKDSYLVGLSLYDTSLRRDQVRSASRPCIPDLLEWGASLRLRLVEPIQTGKHRLSQVWRCSYTSPSQQASDNVVILKLFQESLRPFTKRLFDYNIPVEEDIKRESHAYQQLRDLQGSILPYSYGFYNFTLPCAEKVVGHVMEFIPGDQLDKRAQNLIHDFDKLHELFISALSAVYTLHQYQIRHADIKLRNIMTVDPANVVLVDFGSSSDFADEPQDRHLSDIKEFVQACFDVPELAKAARIWIATHLKDPMLQGVPYMVLPFDPSVNTEDNLPIIAIDERKYVIPPSNTEKPADGW